jgi:hypothetical protein
MSGGSLVGVRLRCHGRGRGGVFYRSGFKMTLGKVGKIDDSSAIQDTTRYKDGINIPSSNPNELEVAQG